MMTPKFSGVVFLQLYCGNLDFTVVYFFYLKKMLFSNAFTLKLQALVMPIFLSTNTITLLNFPIQEVFPF